MYGVEIPQDVPLGGKFEDSRLAGLDVEVVNKKVGRIITFERELIDDDQTGQISKKSGELGSRMRYKEEADVNGVDVFTNVAQGRGLTGVSGTSYTSAIGNAPQAGNTPLSQPALEAADIAMHQMLDPLGNRIMVRPSILLVSPADKFNAAKLLNSTLQPSVPGAAGQTASTAASGLTGWTMTVNPLQGLYNLKVSRFLPSGNWYLIDPTSIVFQDRDPLELLMEARDAGRSFERDEYRYRARRRYQTAVLEYRYIYCGYGV
jgi:phage major head subunit gpT-like protein